MTKLQLKASRALWLRRERYRRRKFNAARTAAARKKWWKLLEEARTNRVRRDRQLAALKPPTSDTRKVSENGVNFIKEFEGFPNGGRPYRDPVGVWTIGYGHIEGVGPNSKPLTKQQASDLLRHDLDKLYAPHVQKLKLPMTQAQFDAIVSAVYNLGPGILAPDRSLGGALRSGSPAKVAAALRLYDKAGGRTLPGLTRRRNAEARLYTTGSYNTD